ncbi:hypothetical protein M8C21_026398, partial [Ambrosia artemisiifolia]
MLRASGNQTSTNPSSSLEDVDTKEDSGAPKGSDAAIEPDPSQKSDNIVLQKLLRGPRYFDPPDDSWGNCYNCGESGHITANCTSAKRKKPCFVCGSLEHHVKQCNKGKDCFICKKSGHLAKDCPEKSNRGSQSTKICLNCGDSGHELLSCESTYSPDDLKEIQCYVCKCFGHLCCVNYAGEGSTEISCYRCGQLGHSGLECARVHAETASKWTPSSCYMCGQEAHTKRKRKMDSSTPKKKKKKSKTKNKKKQQQKKNDSVGKYGNNLGARSMLQPNPRGGVGWVTGDPSAYNHSHNHYYNHNYSLHNHKYNHNYNHNHNYDHNHGWGSPITPPMYIPNARFQFHGSNGYQSYNDRFQFHGGHGYQASNYRFQYHGGSGYNPVQASIAIQEYFMHQVLMDLEIQVIMEEDS